MQSPRGPGEWGKISVCLRQEVRGKKVSWRGGQLPGHQGQGVAFGDVSGQIVHPRKTFVCWAEGQSLRLVDKVTSGYHFPKEK